MGNAEYMGIVAIKLCQEKHIVNKLNKFTVFVEKVVKS